MLAATWALTSMSPNVNLLSTLAVLLQTQHCCPFNFWAPLYFLVLFWIWLGPKDVMSISGFYVRLGYRLSLPKWKTVVRKLLNILCKTDIKISYITLRESCGLDAELLAFHIGAGIMISLWLQKVCRYSFMPLVFYLFTWRSILITWLSYIFIFIHP